MCRSLCSLRSLRFGRSDIVMASLMLRFSNVCLENVLEFCESSAFILWRFS